MHKLQEGEQGADGILQQCSDGGEPRTLEEHRGNDLMKA